MKIHRDKLIHGVRALTLHRLLRAGRFTTPDAMEATGLGEPDCSQRLVELATSGWIAYAGEESSIDRWTAGQLGEWMNLTRSDARLTAAGATRLVERIVAMVRLSNSDPASTARITNIYLFGSALPDCGEGAVSDVDICVTTRDRIIQEQERIDLLRAEMASSPDPYDRTWPHGKLVDAILRLSRRIDLHTLDDVGVMDPRLSHIYHFDVETEREVRTDPKPFRASKKWLANARSSIATHRFNSSALPTVIRSLGRTVRWPRGSDDDRLVCITSAEAALAEHLWRKGVPLDAIARQVGGSDLSSIEEYLAGHRERGSPDQPEFDASFRHTVERAAGDGLDEPIECEAWIGGRCGNAIFVHFPARSQNRRELVGVTNGDDCAWRYCVPRRLLSVARRVANALRQWAAITNPSADGVMLFVSTTVSPSHVRTNVVGGSHPIDFSPVIEEISGRLRQYAEWAGSSRRKVADGVEVRFEGDHVEVDFLRQGDDEPAMVDAFSVESEAIAVRRRHPVLMDGAIYRLIAGAQSGRTSDLVWLTRRKADLAAPPGAGTRRPGPF